MLARYHTDVFSLNGVVQLIAVEISARFWILLGVGRGFPASSKGASWLGAKFESFGSDKGFGSMTRPQIAANLGHPPHSYHVGYQRIIENLNPNSVERVLEIGIGTASPSNPSSMGIKGSPGASLLSWKSIFANAEVYGCDIEEDCLVPFGERIQTFWVDQLSKVTLTRAFGELLGRVGRFDLIVDDGLHTLPAAINTFTAALPLLKPSGYYVIEDVEASWSLELFREIGKSLGDSSREVGFWFFGSLRSRQLQFLCVVGPEGSNRKSDE